MVTEFSLQFPVVNMVNIHSWTVSLVFQSRYLLCGWNCEEMDLDCAIWCLVIVIYNLLHFLQPAVWNHRCLNIHRHIRNQGVELEFGGHENSATLYRGAKCIRGFKLGWCRCWAPAISVTNADVHGCYHFRGRLPRGQWLNSYESAGCHENSAIDYVVAERPLFERSTAWLSSLIHPLPTAVDQGQNVLRRHGSAGWHWVGWWDPQNMDPQVRQRLRTSCNLQHHPPYHGVKVQAHALVVI